jgi:transposase
MPCTCPESTKLLVELVIERGSSVVAAADAAGVSERTVYRWLSRSREGASRSFV